MSRFYVYGLYRDVEMTDPFYIGKGNDRRINAHEKSSEIAKRHNIRKNNTIKKLVATIGVVPKKIIKDSISELEAFTLEITLIDKYGRLDIGTGCLTNLSGGGTGASPSPETRAKIRIARARQVITAETKAKMSAAHLGKKFSPEARANMSAARKGIPINMSPEGRARQKAGVSRSLKGKKKSAQTIARMRAAHTGKKFSPSHRASLAAAARRRYNKNSSTEQQRSV